MSHRKFARGNRILLVLFFMVFFIFALPNTTHASSTFDLATPANWNIRFDGPDTGSLAHTDVLTADLNGNGQLDLIIPSFNSDLNSRPSSGSVFIIYDSLLSKLTGKGNTVDLADPANYNIRFDGGPAGTGSATGNELGNGLNVADIDNDGHPDLLLGAPTSDYNSRRNSGSLFVIYNSLFSQYLGTGNNVDLVNTSNFNIRIDGDQGDPGGSLGISDAIVETSDFDGDNKQDLMVIQPYGVYNSRTNVGALFILYNNLLDNYTGTGNLIDLANSANYNLRFIGATSEDRLSAYGLHGVDLDTDNKQDILISAGIANYNANDTGSFYIINNNLFNTYTGTGNSIDMAVTSNWSMRFDGAVTGDVLSLASLPPPADLNGDGKLDILVGAGTAGNNGRSQSGSLYAIYGISDILSAHPGTGSILNMSNSDNWNVRFDGVNISDFFGLSSPQGIDFFNTGKVDIVVGARQADNNSRSNSGSFWMIKNNLFSSYVGTGNTVDMANANNWSIRYDGAGVDDILTYLKGSNFFDVNGDGKLDMLLGANRTDYNSRTNSGSMYLIYNFPHTITQSTASRSDASVNIAGSVSASNSITNIAGVQYQIDSNSPTGNWSTCTANDGLFDSTSEPFTCTTTTAPITNGTHTVYIRAYDTNTSYTAQSYYLTYSYAIGSSNPSSSEEQFQIPQLSGGSKISGVFTPIKDSNTGNQNILTIIEPNTFKFDAFLSSQFVDPLVLSNKKHNLLSLLSAGRTLWQIGKIQQIWYKAYPPRGSDKDPARIIPELQSKPSIIALSYKDIDLIPPGKPRSRFNSKTLKLAHSLDGITWKVLPTSVVDTVNHTVAALDRVGGYYVIVAGER